METATLTYARSAPIVFFHILITTLLVAFFSASLFFGIAKWQIHLPNSKYEQTRYRHALFNYCQQMASLVFFFEFALFGLYGTKENIEPFQFKQN